MVRNNEDRFGPRSSGGEEVPPSESPKNILQFVTPTEFVELPSGGAGYPVGHKLHSQETIEIKHMTAKHEDILTSRTLLKNGLALDRLISELICDNDIKSTELLICDRNAIVISARSAAYGSDYNTKVKSPACDAMCKRTFDLTEPTIYDGEDWGDYDIKKLDSGNFMVKLPWSEFNVEVKLLRGNDEKAVFKMLRNKKGDNHLVTKQMTMFIVAVEGHTQPNVIKHFIENIPSAQSRYLRAAYDKITPSIRIMRHFECDECEHEQEMEVSLGADFFWPDR